MAEIITLTTSGEADVLLSLHALALKDQQRTWFVAKNARDIQQELLRAPQELQLMVVEGLWADRLSMLHVPEPAGALRIPVIITCSENSLQEPVGPFYGIGCVGYDNLCQLPDVYNEFFRLKQSLGGREMTKENFAPVLKKALESDTARRNMDAFLSNAMEIADTVVPRGGCIRDSDNIFSHLSVK